MADVKLQTLAQSLRNCSVNGEGSRGRFGRALNAESSFVFEETGSANFQQKASTHTWQFRDNLEAMDRAFKRALVEPLQQQEATIATLEAIDRQVEEAYQRWKAKPGFIQWVKQLLFDSSISKAKLSFQLTLRTKIQKLTECKNNSDKQALVKRIQQLEQRDPSSSLNRASASLPVAQEASSQAIEGVKKSLEELTTRLRALEVRPVQSQDLKAAPSQREENRFSEDLAKLNQQLSALSRKVDELATAQSAPKPQPQEQLQKDEITRQIASLQASLQDLQRKLDPLIQADVLSRLQQLGGLIVKLEERFVKGHNALEEKTRHNSDALQAQGELVKSVSDQFEKLKQLLPLIPHMVVLQEVVSLFPGIRGMAKAHDLLSKEPEVLPKESTPQPASTSSALSPAVVPPADGGLDQAEAQAILAKAQRVLNNKTEESAASTPPQQQTLPVKERRGVTLEAIKDFAQKLAGVEKNVDAPIFAYLEEVSRPEPSGQLTTYYDQLLQFIHPEAIRENPEMMSAVQEFEKSHPKFFPRLTLRLSTGEVVKINLILARALSSYFENECSPGEQSKTITLNYPEVTPVFLNQLREFMEFGGILNGDLIAIYKAAAVLKIESLLAYCRKKIKLDNYILLRDLASLAMTYNDMALKFQCLEHIRKQQFTYPESIVNQLPKDFLDLAKEYKIVLTKVYSVNFKIPDARGFYQLFPSFTPFSFSAVEICNDGNDFIPVCEFSLKLGYEKVVINNGAAGEFGAVLKRFKSVAFAYNKQIPSIQTLLEILSSNSEVVELRLNSVKFADEKDVDRFFEALVRNKKVRTLDLSNNDICYTHTEKFARCLVENDTLQHLIIDLAGSSREMVEEEGPAVQQKLSQALSKNRGLVALQINYPSNRIHNRDDLYSAIRDRQKPLEVSCNGLAKNVRAGKGQIEIFSRYGWSSW